MTDINIDFMEYSTYTIYGENATKHDKNNLKKKFNDVLLKKSVLKFGDVENSYAFLKGYIDYIKDSEESRESLIKTYGNKLKNNKKDHKIEVELLQDEIDRTKLNDITDKNSFKLSSLEHREELFYKAEKELENINKSITESKVYKDLKWEIEKLKESLKSKQLQHEAVSQDYKDKCDQYCNIQVKYETEYERKYKKMEKIIEKDNDDKLKYMNKEKMKLLNDTIKKLEKKNKNLKSMNSKLQIKCVNLSSDSSDSD